MCWWNTVTTPWVLNYWDGTQCVPVYGISPSSHLATFLGAVAPSSLPSGVDANVVVTVTGNTSISTSNCGQTIQAGTGSTGFFTVTVPSISSFPATCVVNITNGDTTTLRGKGIAGLSGSGCSTQNILWPGQTCKIGIVNGAWAVLSRPGRWRSPNLFGRLTNFYSDYVNGTDTLGATDGLAPGASAFKTVQQCLNTIVDQIDFATTGQTQAACNPAAATTDLQGLHLPFHDLVGAQGGNALQVIGASLSISGAVSNGGLCEITVPATATYSASEIVSVYNVGGATGCNGTWKVTVTDGTHLTLQSTTFGSSYTSGGTVTNGSAFSVSGNPAVGCYFQTNIAFSNEFFQSNSTSFAATDGCFELLGAGNIFGGTPQTFFNINGHAQIHLNADIGFASGATNAAVQATGQGQFVSDNTVNINFLPGINPSFSGLGFVYADTLGEVSFLNITINLNGNAVTGPRWQVASGGVILSATGNANTYFPGNSNGLASAGGNIDGVVIPPNPSASTLGGIESIVAAAHQWIDSISTAGAPHQSQPGFSDLSGALAQTQAPAGGSNGQAWQTNGSGTASWASLRQILTGGSNTSIALGTTDYCWINCGATLVSSALSQAISPIGGTLKNLTVNVVTAPGVGQTVVATVYVGAFGAPSATALTCSIGGTNTSCVDLTHSAAVSAGNVYSVQIVTSAAAASTGRRGIRRGI